VAAIDVLSGYAYAIASAKFVNVNRFAPVIREMPVARCDPVNAQLVLLPLSIELRPANDLFAVPVIRLSATQSVLKTFNPAQVKVALDVVLLTMLAR
jgi:hypothetical protein